MKRNASAVWQGDLKQGKGAISTASGTLSNTQYSFSTRFENGIGTNPEELLAAAHAGCFAMALSGQLGAAGLTAERIEVTATISLGTRRNVIAFSSPRASDAAARRARRATAAARSYRPSRT